MFFVLFFVCFFVKCDLAIIQGRQRHFDECVGGGGGGGGRPGGRGK